MGVSVHVFISTYCFVDLGIRRCVILLHDPHANLSSPSCPSAERMSTAVRAILELMYKLSATTFDLLYLDHSCSLTWFVAGATLIRFLAVKTEAGEQGEVAKISQELAVVRFMLSNLGEKTVIGRESRSRHPSVLKLC